MVGNSIKCPSMIICENFAKLINQLGSFWTMQFFPSIVRKTMFGYFSNSVKLKILDLQINCFINLINVDQKIFLSIWDIHTQKAQLNETSIPKLCIERTYNNYALQYFSCLKIYRGHCLVHGSPLASVMVAGYCLAPGWIGSVGNGVGLLCCWYFGICDGCGKCGFTNFGTASGNGAIFSPTRRSAWTPTLAPGGLPIIAPRLWLAKILYY